MAQAYPEDRGAKYAIHGGRNAVVIAAWLDQPIAGCKSVMPVARNDVAFELPHPEAILAPSMSRAND